VEEVCCFLFQKIIRSIFCIILQQKSEEKNTDFLITSGADIYVVGLKITTKVSFTGPEFCSNYIFQLHFLTIHV
jgi:hypothetical protein